MTTETTEKEKTPGTFIFLADNHTEKFPDVGFDYRFKVFQFREEAERAAAKMAERCKVKFRVFGQVSAFAAVTGEAE
jgi:peptide methionine sulfoxide reductase MsrA